MDAALAGLLGGIGGGLAVGGFGYVGTRSTLRAEWRRAHNDRLTDRRFDAYQEVCVFATTVTGVVANVMNQLHGGDGTSGPTLPDDDQWSRLSGTLHSDVAETVQSSFGGLSLATNAFARSTLMVPGKRWIARAVPPERLPDIKSKAQAVRVCSGELVSTINRELTAIPEPL